jgi:hypothetical protein
VFGHGRAQVAQRHAPLLGRQLGEGLLVGLLDRFRRGGPDKVAVALERLLVCQFARGGRRGCGSALPGPRLWLGTAAKQTIRNPMVRMFPDLGVACAVQARLVDDVVVAVPASDAFEVVESQLGEQGSVEARGLVAAVEWSPGRPTTSCSASGVNPSTIASRSPFSSAR